MELQGKHLVFYLIIFGLVYNQCKVRIKMEPFVFSDTTILPSNGPIYNAIKTVKMKYYEIHYDQSNRMVAIYSENVQQNLDVQEINFGAIMQMQEEGKQDEIEQLKQQQTIVKKVSLKILNGNQEDNSEEQEEQILIKDMFPVQQGILNLSLSSSQISLGSQSDSQDLQSEQESQNELIYDQNSAQQQQDQIVDKFIQENPESFIVTETEIIKNQIKSEIKNQEQIKEFLEFEIDCSLLRTQRTLYVGSQIAQKTEDQQENEKHVQFLVNFYNRQIVLEDFVQAAQNQNTYNQEKLKNLNEELFQQQMQKSNSEGIIIKGE